MAACRRRALIVALALAGPAHAQQYSSVPAVEIPDEPGATLQDIIVVTGGPTSITALACIIDVPHMWGQDIDAILCRGDPLSPTSTYLLLATDNGGAPNLGYANTRFIDDAHVPITAGFPPYSGSFLPEAGAAAANGWDNATIPMNGAALAGFAGWNGMDSNTDWHLAVDDDTIDNTGTLFAWTLDFSPTPTPPPPANDDCADAITLTAGQPLTYFTHDASPDGSSACDPGPNSPDVWYRYTSGPGLASVTIELCGAEFNTIVAAYADCGGAELGCNDQGCGDQSRLTLLQVAPNTAMLIRVAGWEGDRGSGPILVTETPAPTNDSCSTPIAVAADSLTPFDTFTATGDGFATCGSSFSADLWYSYNAGPSAQAVRVELCGSNFDTVLAVFDACAGNELICNDDGCALATSRLDLCQVRANTTYLIRVGGFESSYGSGSLRLSPIPSCGGPTCDPDFNCDGNPDQDDVGCIINVVAGNPGCECQDPDFNADGNVDQDDVIAVINVVAGGPCP